ncbi:MAG: hypothetical protein MJE77_38565 [Proteobacteria bacterium]|nr:hypothetical protein [Pseudomonadota bacterium]
MTAKIAFFCSVLMAIGFIASACTKDSQKRSRDETDQQKVERPHEVIALLELPSLHDVGSAAEVINTFQPGSSGFLTAMLAAKIPQLASASSLDGADLARPVRAIFVAPKKHEYPVLLAVSVTDGDKLKKSASPAEVVAKDGFAVIGASDVVSIAKMSEYGLSLSRTSKSKTRATVFIEPVMASYRANVQSEIGEIKRKFAALGATGPLSQFLDVYMQVFSGLTEQTESVELSPAVKGKLAGIDVILHPRPGSLLAGIISAQRSNNFELMAKLPAASPALVIGGELHIGPALDTAVDMATRVFGAVLSKGSGDKNNDQMRSLIEPWVELTSGEFAMGLTSFLPRPRLSQLFRVTDGARAKNQLVRMMKAMADVEMEMMGVTQTISIELGAFVHDGIEVARQKTLVELKENTAVAQAAIAAQSGGNNDSYFATVDSYFLGGMGDEGAIRDVIDSVRGKSSGLKPTGDLAQVLTMARQQKDSVVLFVDLTRMAVASASPTSAAMTGVGGLGLTEFEDGVASASPTSAAMTLGFADTSARLFLGAAAK